MKHRSLEKIDALPEDQRQQLADWLESHTLDQCVELVKDKLGAEIPRSTLNRFRKRCENGAFLDTTPDSARARAEIINAAASGKPNFSQATVDLLEKQAFELAHETRDPESVRALKDLFGLVLKHENLGVRKRMAAVQEGKLKLRQQQFEAANKEDDTDAKIRDLNAKIADAFSQHPVLTAIHNAEAAADSTGASLAQQTLPTTDNIALSHDAPDPDQFPIPDSQFSILNDPSHSTRSPSNESDSPHLPPLENSRPREAPSTEPAIHHPETTKLRDHAVRRWRSHLPRPYDSPEPDGAWRDECPCGHPLPCLAHPDLHLRTRLLKPHQADYALALQQAGLPCYLPTAAELACSEELLKKIFDPFALNPRHSSTFARSA